MKMKWLIRITLAIVFASLFIQNIGLRVENLEWRLATQPIFHDLDPEGRHSKTGTDLANVLNPCHIFTFNDIARVNELGCKDEKPVNGTVHFRVEIARP